jgi:hypothetical protein
VIEPTWIRSLVGDSDSRGRRQRRERTTTMMESSVGRARWRGQAIDCYRQWWW